MMSLLIALEDILLPVLAAASVSIAFLAVAWPYLHRDALQQRVARLTGELDAIRTRERARLHGDGRASLRNEPKKLYKNVVEYFKLSKFAESSALVQKLRMAGYRGRGPLVTFVATRVLVPPVLFLLALVYTLGVLQLSYPLPVNIGIAGFIGLLGYYAPTVFLQNRIGKRQLSIRRAWPDALDLMLICAESGMSVESAFRKVAEEIGPQSIDLAEELSLTTAELSYLPERRKAYENLAQRTGLDAVRHMVTTLIQAEKYGTPVGQSLRVLARESRDARMTEAEKRAASLPPKLTVPMILFFLPVLFAVIVTPAIIQIAATK